MTSLKKNIVYNFAYQLLILILPLVTAPYLARVVGAQGIGVYSYSYAIATYFVYFVMLGLNSYGNREIAACQGDREELTRKFWSIYAMQAICFVVAGSCYVVYSLFLADNKIVALLQGLYVLSALFDINWFFFGVEQFKLTVIRNTAIKIATTILIFCFVKTANDVNVYIAIMSGGFLASQLVIWLFLKRFIGFYAPKIKDVLPHFKPNAILFFSVIAVSMYTILSKVLLGYMAGTAAVGFFENAAKLVAVPIALVSAIGTVMLPRASALIAQGDKGMASAHIDRTMRGVMLFTSLAAFGIPSVAFSFTYLFYGPGFDETAKALVILSATVPLLGFGNVLRTQHVIPNARDTVMLWSAVCGAVASIGLNIALVPHFGVAGSAFAAVGAEIAVLTYQVARIQREVPMRRYFKLAGSYLVAGGTMAVVLAFIPRFDDALIDVAFRVLFGCLVYALCLFPVEKMLRRTRGHDMDSSFYRE